MKPNEALVFFDDEKELALKVVFSESSQGLVACAYDWASVRASLDWETAEWEEDPCIRVFISPSFTTISVADFSPTRPAKITGLGKVLGEILAIGERYGK